MSESAGSLQRRTFLREGMMAAGGCFLAASTPAWAARVHGKSLFNGRNLKGWMMAEKNPNPAQPGWVVKDGAMASTGAGRGVIYTARDYGRFRWIFSIRHVSGNPDHQACVLIFCTRPVQGQAPLDALGGIQFQVPRGGHWDYRPGHNNAGKGEFREITRPPFDPHQWSRVEIVANAAIGMARMAVAQPIGSKAVEVLAFSDPSAGKSGPIALQMHNAGLFDEYKDLSIEVNPKTLDLITTA